MWDWDCLFKVALQQILLHLFFYGQPLLANCHWGGFQGHESHGGGHCGQVSGTCGLILAHGGRDHCGNCRLCRQFLWCPIRDSWPTFWGIHLQSGTLLSLGIPEAAPLVWLPGLPPLGVPALGSFQTRLSWKEVWGPTILPPGGAKLFSTNWNYSCSSTTWGLPGCMEYSPQRLSYEMNALGSLLGIHVPSASLHCQLFPKEWEDWPAHLLMQQRWWQGDWLLLRCGRGSNESGWHVLQSRRCDG